MTEDRLYGDIGYDEAFLIMAEMGKIPQNPREDKYGINVHCLFHSDSSPSAYIGRKPDGGLLYQCFGCQIHKKPGYMLDVKRELGLYRQAERKDADPVTDFADWAAQSMGGERPKFTVIDGEGVDPEDDPDEVIPGWEEVDLATYSIDDQPAPAHGLIADTDGWALFYPASINEVHGKSESMKTWVALTCLVEAVQRGEYAVFLDFEDGPGPIAARLRAYGLDDAAIARVQYRYVTNGISMKKLKKLIKSLLRNQPSVAIVNGVIEALALQSIDTIDNRGYTAWVRMYPRPLADGGACVILIDHTSIKDSGNGSALGATAKMNIIQGASYEVVIEKEFAPAKDRIVTGVTQLKLSKDRPGHVRRHGFKRGDVVAELNMTAHPGGKVEGRFEAASHILNDLIDAKAKEQAGIDHQLQIWTAIANRMDKGMITKDLEILAEKIGYPRDNGLRKLLQSWVNGGHVEVRKGPMNSRVYVALSDEFPGRISV